MALVTTIRSLLVSAVVLLVPATAAVAAPPADDAAGPDAGALIIGGAPVGDGSWPSIAALVPAGGAPELSTFCGGTLIAPTVVLTAAHCVLEASGSPKPAGAVEALLGTEDLTLPAERIAVAEIRVHPGYRVEGDAPDAALLVLARPSAAPVAAFAAAAAQDRDAERVGAIAGWGEEGDGTAVYPTRLIAAPVTIFSAARCREMLGSAFHVGGALCAGRPEGGADTCAGDSGGPLRDDAGLVVGITSWGVGCGRPGLPGIYTRVASVSGWIAKAMAAPAGSAQAAAPARAPRVRALAAHGRRGATARLRYRLAGRGESTREAISIRVGRRVIARIRTDAGPAHADVEYSVSWRIPRRLAASSRLSFCVATRVVAGPGGGAPSCAPLRLIRG